MVSKPTRTLVDIASIVGIAWMWISVYESFTRSGLWLILARAVGGATTLPSEATVLAACVLVGWLSLSGACWVGWWAFLRDRVGGDFPVARLRH
jgi:hypothetical protein